MKEYIGTMKEDMKRVEGKIDKIFNQKKETEEEHKISKEENKIYLLNISEKKPKKEDEKEQFKIKTRQE